PAVAQVLRVRVALAAVAENGDLLFGDQAQVGIGVVVDFHGSFLPSARPALTHFAIPAKAGTASALHPSFRRTPGPRPASAAPVACGPGVSRDDGGRAGPPSLLLSPLGPAHHPDEARTPDLDQPELAHQRDE